MDEKAMLEQDAWWMCIDRCLENKKIDREDMTTEVSSFSLLSILHTVLDFQAISPFEFGYNIDELLTFILDFLTVYAAMLSVLGIANSEADSSRH
jgi:hypothetical protein